MKVTDGGRPTTTAEGFVFIEQYVLPSMEICKKLEMDKKIVSGGPIAGSMEFVMVFDVESITELDNLLEGLPIWVRMHTSVRQLVRFEDRISHIRSRLEGMRKRPA